MLRHQNLFLFLLQAGVLHPGTGLGVWGCSARCCWLCQHCDGNEFANSSLKTTFTRWPDLCGLEPAGATREGFQPPNTPRERGGREGGGTSSPSQGGIEEQCSAQRCSEHLHTCGQPRVTQAPAGITQHRGGLLTLHLPLHFLAGLPGGSAQGIKPYMVCSVEPLAEPSFSTPKCGLVCPGVGGKLQRIQILHPLPPQIPAWS